MEFAVGAESVVIRPSTGLRRGDALSTTTFNLAAEPLPRAAKTRDFDGFTVSGQEVRVTAYADDLAVVSTAPSYVLGPYGQSPWSRVYPWEVCRPFTEKCYGNGD